LDFPVSVIVNNELGRIYKEEIVSNPRYKMILVRRNCSVRKNLDQGKRAMSQNVAPGHLMYEGLQVTRF